MAKRIRIKTVSYHLISAVLVNVSIILAFTMFRPVLGRFKQALFEDFLQSIVFYFKNYVALIFGGMANTDAPSVATLPQGVETLIPLYWGDFLAKCERFLEAFFQWERFLSWALITMERISLWVAIAAPLVIDLVMIAYLVLALYKTPNNNCGKKSKPLRAFLVFEEKVLYKIRDYVKGYFQFFRDHKLLKILLATLWLINLNIVTIVLEMMAYILYFSMSFDIASIWTQIVRTFYDVSVPLRIVPLWVVLIIAYKIFDNVRRKMGLDLLRTYESRNVEFLKAYPGALFLVGRQRAKKTTIITDMALSQEVIFREEALELLKERDKQFPHFPWQALENFYWDTQEILPTMASHREFLGLLRWYYKNLKGKRLRLKEMALKKLRKFGYKFDDFCFGYDVERYGETYNDGLKIVNVFDAIEGYVQLFYVYAARTSLVFGNYSIRTDLRWQDSGNFPVLDGDFFSRPPEEMDETSQYCHVAKMDCFRLGVVSDPLDPYINGFEVGILNMMEGGKERGNQNTNAAVKATDSGVNAKNDGFELDIKMRAHGSTVDNYTFFRFFIDEQRADSLSADNKDLCTIVMIKDAQDSKVVLPFAMFDRWVYAKATKIYEKIYYTLRNIRGDANETLLVYLLKKIYSPIFRHWDRIDNEYKVYVANLNVRDAMQDTVLTDHGKYYISAKKSYSERFATNAMGQFYHNKAKKSRYGLNDFPVFEGKFITIEEMESSGSIFYKKAINAFHNTELQKQRLEAMKSKKGA